MGIWSKIVYYIFRFELRKSCFENCVIVPKSSYPSSRHGEKLPTTNGYDNRVWQSSRIHQGILSRAWQLSQSTLRVLFFTSRSKVSSQCCWLLTSGDRSVLPYCWQSLCVFLQGCLQWQIKCHFSQFITAENCVKILFSELAPKTQQDPLQP